MENELESQERRREHETARSAPAESPPLRLPLALTMVALLIWFGFQTVDLAIDRRNLTSLKSNYDAATQEAEKIRTQVETLIGKTAELASKGNPNAKAAVEELQKRGIPIQSAAAPSK
ncbi:MAG TPA: hypothetical protein VGL11_01105 [Candidatus Binatia bacterium]|jgi:hypothetical protein